MPLCLTLPLCQTHPVEVTLRADPQGAHIVIVLLQEGIILEIFSYTSTTSVKDRLIVIKIFVVGRKSMSISGSWVSAMTVKEKYEKYARKELDIFFKVVLHRLGREHLMWFDYCYTLILPQLPHGCFLHKCYTEFCSHKYFGTACQEAIWRNQYWCMNNKRKITQNCHIHISYSRLIIWPTLYLSPHILYSSWQLWVWWWSGNQLSAALSSFHDSNFYDLIVKDLKSLLGRWLKVAVPVFKTL